MAGTLSEKESEFSLCFVGQYGRVTATDPSSWPGHVLRGTVASWRRFDEVFAVDPVHVWLEFEGLGWVRLHTPGDGSLGLTLEAPGEAVDMAEFGSIESHPSTPEALTSLVGSRVDAVASLWQEPPGHAVGWVLFAGDVAVGLANLSDELTVAAWPSEDWRVVNVSQR